MRYLLVFSMLAIGLATAPAAESQTVRPRPATPSSAAKPAATPRPRPAATPKLADENTEWTRIKAIVEPEDRLRDLKKFITAFPRSTRRSEAVLETVKIQAEFGNILLASNELAQAVEQFRSAVADLPTPIPADLFTDFISKIPLNLFYRGGQDAAIAIAKKIEEKAAGSSEQMLSLAEFYLNIENGTEAKRLLAGVIEAQPDSASAYLLLGLAERMDFRFEESAKAFEKAYELDPTRTDAKRGRAEMERALGRSRDAVAIYRELIAAEPDDLPSRSGLVLALFESGELTDAEAALERELEANPSNVLLLGGVAYQLAARGNGKRAVEYAQRAIAADPRFIWSHIALARGQLLTGDPVSAEKTLITARRYGNFPTLDYELATVRAAIGFYRDASEDLARVFSVADGKVSTRLGGRVPMSADNIIELISNERRASIFAPTAADSPENGEMLTSLLKLRQEYAKAEPNADAVTAAATEFINGDDKMRLHRKLYAANLLMEKDLAPDKVLDIATNATADVDAGLTVASPAGAVFSGELYERRTVAIQRGEYILVPDVPRQTLSAIVRGRIEELSGWAMMRLDRDEDAIVRLRRAVGVLPADSTWWRSSLWRLGMALESTGKEQEALEAYTRSYAGGPVNVFRYRLIAGLYQKLNGNTVGLVERIGEDPAPVVAAIPKPTEEPSPSPTPTPETVPADENVDKPKENTPEPSPTPNETDAEPKKEPETKEPIVEKKDSDPAEDGEPVKPKEEPTQTPKPVTEKAKPKELFPSVVIEPGKPVVKPSPTPADDEPKVEPSEAAVATARTRVVNNEAGGQCKFWLSQDALELRSSGAAIALVVGREDDGDIEGLKVEVLDTDAIAIRREPITGITTRAVYVVASKNGVPGIYRLRLELPCAEREIVVTVR